MFTLDGSGLGPKRPALNKAAVVVRDDPPPNLRVVQPRSRPGVQFACWLLRRNPPCSLAEVTMNSVRTTFLCLLALPLCASCFAQSSGPDTRQIPDPKSLRSESNPAARALPIDD